MSLTVDLPPDLDAFVDARVEAGDYASAEAVIQAALVLLRERERRRANVDALIDQGLASASRGVYSAEEAMAELDRIIEAR